MSNIKTPTTPSKDQGSPAKFVKPADLFKMRCLFKIEPQSPLKCLNNLSDPSPTKNLPTLLRNPFNKPVKRRLNLGFSPTKDGSLMRSPNKRTKMLEINEDANMEAPKMKQHRDSSKGNNNNKSGQCYQNDWTLRTKLRLNFDSQCKNWNETTISTHKRRSGNAAAIEDSPSKLNDKTISVEAIKNVSTVYQHPYLSWQPLYPRITLEFSKRKENPFTLTEHSQVTNMMHKDWCESLDDLSNLLVEGRCPYFYMCSDNYNILFKTTPSSNPRKPTPQAYISPFSYGMGCELNKLGVEFRCPELSRNNSSNCLINMARENSQASFTSSHARTTGDENDSSQEGLRQGSKPNVSSSIDSGNVSDLDDEDDFGEDENEEETSRFLESIGLSQQDFPSLQSKRKGFVEADSNTQNKSTSNKPLATIEGANNLGKLVKFLQANRLYTISNVGKFACIPPTLLSPCEFRLSTPQYPEVVVNKNSTSPSFVDLKGTILPKLYVELHKLLTISDNTEHSCISTVLDSSIPFGSIPH